MTQRRVLSLVERQKIALNDKITAAGQYEELEYKLSALEAATAPLASLHQVAQSKATNLYSELLTSIVCDVMGEKEQYVKLSTTISRGKPSLTIESVKNGETEDLVEDRGLSVTNLVAAGLRFVALVQSSARRFVILDEPECWVEQKLVPRFINVVERLCDEIGVQALVISHHSAEHISSSNTHVVRVENCNGKVKVTTLIKGDDHKPSLSRDRNYKEITDHIDIGLRYIRLTNFQSHSDTVIELGRGLTVLTGPNETGKSAVVRAVRGLRDNQVRDALISHNEKTATVEVGVECDTTISWSISRKSKYGFYRVIQNGECVDETELPHLQQAPLVTSLLAMEKGDIDIHIAHQSDPLFLLNPSISGMRRAALLNLGEEQQITSAMVIKHSERVKETKAQMKAQQSILEHSNRVLENMQGLDTLCELHDICAGGDTAGDEVEKAIYLLDHVPDYSEAFSVLSSLLDILHEDESLNHYAQALATLEHQHTCNECELATIEALLSFSNDSFSDVDNAYQMAMSTVMSKREFATIQKEIANIEQQQSCPTCGHLWLDKAHTHKEVELC